MAKIAINGFGRIGRLFFKAALGMPGMEIVAINDLGDVENLSYLLKYDSVYGRYPKEIKADAQNGKLIVDGAEVKFLQVKDPTQLTLEKPGGLEEFGRPRRGSQVVEQAGRGVGVIDGEFAGESVQQIARRGWKGAGRREDVGQVVAQPHDLGSYV